MTVVRNVFEARPRFSSTPSLVARARLAARQRPSWWRDEWDDQVLFLAVALIWTAWTWRRDKYVKQRLADVAVPNGIVVTVVCFVVARQRARNQEWRKASASLSEVSRALTAERLEGLTAPSIGSPDQLPAFQASVDSLTKQASERDERLVTLNDQVVTLTRQLMGLSSWLAGTAIAVVILAVAAAAVWIVSSH
jgi:hypothetical protein